jgi:hypothetical protein
MTTHPRREPKPDDAAKKREDEALDEALEESFPASDPPASTAPGHRDPEDEAAKSSPRR